MKLHFKILTVLCFWSNVITAQTTFSSKVIDQKTEKPIAYASILFNAKNGVITNTEGEFNITIKRNIKPTDSLTISCLGYDEKRIALSTYNNETIYLNTKTVDLDEVLITNKEYTIEEIIDNIKENLDKNYKQNLSERKLFFRESYYTSLNKNKVTLEKSSIPEINQQFIDSLLRAVPKNNSSHTEILGKLYGNNNKPQKMDILKACRLYDKTADINLDNYEKRFNDIFKKYVKRDSYFKIKSGWFSTKEAIDSSLFGDEKQTKEVANAAKSEEQKKKDSLRKTGFFNWKKSSINRTENNSFISTDSDLNFIHKSRRYEFNIKDYAFVNDMFVYVIDFKPKRNENYEGTIYVNTADFAIVRVDYHNIKPLRNFSLLGVSVKEYEKKGTIIYEKNETNNYALKYLEQTKGQRVGLKRPIKIVEKNKNVKGRRKQNEVKGKINFIVYNTDKTELIVFDNAKLSQSDFKNFKENPRVTPKHLNKYDPNFWKGYNIIEPNKAIKEFKAIGID